MKFYLLIALGIYVLIAQPMPSGNGVLGIAAIAGGIFWLWLINKNKRQ